MITPEAVFMKPVPVVVLFLSVSDSICLSMRSSDSSKRAFSKFFSVITTGSSADGAEAGNRLVLISTRVFLYAGSEKERAILMTKIVESAMKIYEKIRI